MAEVQEVTFLAFYIGPHAPDKRTFQCASILEAPPKYHYDKGADGAIMASEIEPHAILIRGIDKEAVESLSWTPTLLQYKDPETGELKELLGRIQDSIEPRTVKFALDMRQPVGKTA